MSVAPAALLVCQGAAGAQEAHGGFVAHPWWQELSGERSPPSRREEYFWGAGGEDV